MWYGFENLFAMTKLQIAVAGLNGSGKTTAAKAVAKWLGYRHCSSGDYARLLAERRGMQISVLTQVAHSDKGVDYDSVIDAWVKQHADQERFVMDTRLGIYFLPDSFKVFLTIDPHIAAERIFNDMQNNPDRSKTEKYDSVEAVYKELAKRYKADCERYQERYNIDYKDHSICNLVIDAGLPENTKERVQQLIIDGFQSYLKQTV